MCFWRCSTLIELLTFEWQLCHNSGRIVFRGGKEDLSETLPNPAAQGRRATADVLLWMRHSGKMYNNYPWKCTTSSQIIVKTEIYYFFFFFRWIEVAMYLKRTLAGFQIWTGQSCRQPVITSKLFLLSAASLETSRGVFQHNLLVLELHITFFIKVFIKPFLNWNRIFIHLFIFPKKLVIFSTICLKEKKKIKVKRVKYLTRILRPIFSSWYPNTASCCQAAFHLDNGYFCACCWTEKN